MTGRQYRRTKYPLREDAFDAITRESAYWLGMLITDGCVSRGYLSLASVDLTHLEAFRDFLGSKHKISVRKHRGGFSESRPVGKIAIGSQRLIAAVAKYGIVPRKSKMAKVRLLENDADFWRGAVDGDGWINVKTPSLGLTGSKQLVSQFKAFCLCISPESKAKLGRNHSVWRFLVYGRAAKRIMAALYGDATVFLTRKKALADKWLEGWQDKPTYAELAREHGITRSCLCKRLKRGWKLNEALAG